MSDQWAEDATLAQMAAADVPAEEKVRVFGIGRKAASKTEAVNQTSQIAERAADMAARYEDRLQRQTAIIARLQAEAEACTCRP